MVSHPIVPFRFLLCWIISRAAPSARQLGIALSLALLLSALIAVPAQAQTDEIPSVSVHSSSQTAMKGGTVVITLSASSVPAEEVTINTRFEFQGVSKTLTVLPWYNIAPPNSTHDILTGFAVNEDFPEHEDATLTVTVLPGDGYTVGSPSELTVRVLGVRDSQQSDRDSRQSDGDSPAPRVTPTPNPVIGTTSASTATVLPGDRLVLQRHDLPDDQTGNQPDTTLDLGIGWVSMDGSRVILVGVIRDTPLGQTYIIVRHEGDNRVVRRWVSPTSPLIHAIDWNVVNTQYTVPTAVLAAVPLDDRLPEPNMLARRFDGGDDRIFAYDAELQQWRHIPNWPTFQALGFYWCNVTAADAGFFDRITIGPPYPATTEPARDDYPNCSTG